MRIFNGTPHPVAFYRQEDVEFDEKTRKFILKDGALPFLSIESNGILNAHIVWVRSGDINSIPRYEMCATDIDPIPTGFDVVIVSNLYANIALSLGVNGLNKLYTIVMPVYSTDLKPVGCLGLAKVKKEG